MAAIAAVVAFALAVILGLVNFHSGNWNSMTFVDLGLLFIALHLVRPVWWRGNPPQ
jgi:hypothetical protein